MRQQSYRYKAFISYSHAADSKLAPKLHAALHKFAKPFWKLRAMRLFRDESNLTDNPDAPGLWSAIVKALGESEHFLFLASPTAAQSKWTRDEVGLWLSRRGVTNLMLVLTEGEIVWDRVANDFDWNKTTALPRSLEKAFPEEPWFADLRFARDGDDLSLRNPDFLKPVGRIAARIHRRQLDEIVGEDVRQHRITKAVSWVAVAAILTGAVAAVWEAQIANRHSRIAEERRKAALSRQLTVQARAYLPASPDLSLLLALEANRMDTNVMARSVLLEVLQQDPYLAKFLHKGPRKVSSVASSPDGKLLVSGGEDGSVYFWDPVERRALGGRKEHKDTVWSVAFNPAGDIVASAGEDQKIVLWDAATRQPLGKPLARHRDTIWVVAFSPDGRTLASASEDRTVMLWDARTRKPLGAPLRHKAKVYSVTFCPPRGEILASGDKDGTVVLWNMRTRRPILPYMNLHSDTVYSVTCSPDGRLLASAGEDRDVILWDVAKRRPVGPPLKGHTGRIWSVDFRQDGNILASGSEDQSIILWDVVRHRSQGQPIDGHTDTVYGVSFLPPNGGILASAGGDRSVILWDMAKRRPIGRSLDPDETGVGNQPSATGEGRPVPAQASPGGDSAKAAQAASAPDGSSVEILSADTKLKASANTDNSITLSYGVTPLGRPLKGHMDPVRTLAFSSDGRTLKSTSRTGQVFEWDTGFESWQVRACRIAERNLSCEEWREFLGDESYRKTCPDLPGGRANCDPR